MLRAGVVLVRVAVMAAGVLVLLAYFLDNRRLSSVRPSWAVGRRQGSGGVRVFSFRSFLPHDYVMRFLAL